MDHAGSDTAAGDRAGPITESLALSSAPEATGRVPVADTMLGGHYRLQSRLGHGGMADVWQALDERLDRPVAIKLFRPEATHPERERSEMRLLANLNHPGLVTVYDAGIADDSYGTAHSYLVMELITGPTLSQQLDRGRIAPGTVAQLGAELAAAFAYIHERGIVHRDVKPANVLLVAPLAPGHPLRGVKLTDFGIARMLDDTRLTEHGMTIGTPNYLSPEQVHGDQLSPASDVYSLGLLLLECLTGEVVYPGHGIEAAVARLHRAPQIPPALGPDWANVLAPMLAVDPAARPPAAAVAQAFTHLDQHPSTTFAQPHPAASDGHRADPPPSASFPLATGTHWLGAVPSPGAAAVPNTQVPTTDPLRVVSHSASPVPWAEDDLDEPADEDVVPRRRGGLGWLVAAAVLLAVLATMLWLILHSSGSHTAPSPTYPTVTGPIGSHLSKLQTDVRP